MAVIRHNILTNAAARQKYIQGVQLLKAEFPGPTTGDFGLPGPTRQVSTYDLFVIWHHVAMNRFTPTSQSDRNAAHRGPVFLPWHRHMLILIEQHLQRVLQDTQFGLPYWDWGADGELAPAAQAASPLWNADGMGGGGNPVTTGPFRLNNWRVRIEVGVNGQLRATDRGLRRAFAQFAPALPRKSQVQGALRLTTYDASPWGTASTGFRNRVEGWQPTSGGPGLHNRVHVWVGGDMLPSSSPNDPVFYLNHCNVDRIWAAWLQARGPVYAPAQTAAAALQGHRIDDQMFALLSPATTPRQMLNVANIYTYDSLTVA